MKAKKFNKRLSLNKKTIANLNGGMMGNVYGGIILPTKPPAATCLECTTNETIYPCETCYTCETCVTMCDTCDTWCPYFCKAPR